MFNGGTNKQTTSRDMLQNAGYFKCSMGGQTNKQTTSRDKQNAGPGGQEGILSKEFKGESIFHDVK